MKNAYLIIPDLHMGNILAANRINYRDEITRVKENMLLTAIRYKKQGYNVISLFLGDIFHNSYKDVTNALVDRDFLTMWKEKVGECFTVIGNHELTYYKANPFYTSIHTIESENVKKITNKVWTPLGSTNTLRVVDTLQDGEVIFHFNHYGTGIQHTPEDCIHIGLFHQDLIDPQIRDQVELSGSRLSWVNATEIEKYKLLDGYKYCFFGHLHTVYGVWKTGDTFLVYLGSLGRTNETEVRDDFLERNIPAVIVNDGKFETVEDNKFMLPSRKESIYEEVAQSMKELNKEAKERSEARRYEPMGDDPMQSIRTHFAENFGVIKLIDDLQVQDTDTRFIELQRKLRGVGIENIRN